MPIRSNSKKAKRIIRREISGYHYPKEYGTRTALQAMKLNADSYNCGDNRYHSDYQKGAGYVDAGGLACYYDDQAVMLSKIYGKKVHGWSGHKIHATYRHLIAREYDSMLRQQRKKSAASYSKKRGKK